MPIGLLSGRRAPIYGKSILAIHIQLKPFISAKHPLSRGKKVLNATLIGDPSIFATSWASNLDFESSSRLDVKEILYLQMEGWRKRQSLWRLRDFFKMIKVSS